MFRISPPARIQTDLADKIEKLEWEQRFCACGCGRSFRVSLGSAQMHASRDCAGLDDLSGWHASGEQKRTKKGVNRMEASKERQRKNKLPDGMISALEVAARLELKPAKLYYMVSKGQLPGGQINPRCMAFNWEDTKKAWDNRTKVYLPAVKKETPAAPFKAKPCPPGIFKEEIGTAESKFKVTEMPDYVPERAETLFMQSRELARPLVDRARKCGDEKRYEAERELLWMAIEALGFRGMR